MQVPNVAEDPWATVTTAHGFAADELISALQKSIRRGLVENAALTAFEMFSTSPELEEYLWRRLEIISVEDVGFGNLEAPVVIHTLNDFRQRAERESPDRLIYLIHAVRVLALSPKDRTSDEMATWVRHAVAHGEAQPVIHDFMLDMHTKRGQEMGRDFRHWFMEGAQVEHETPNRDRTYRERLEALLSRSNESV